MPKLEITEQERKQRGPDTFLKLSLGETDGGMETTLGITFHDVESEKINVKKGGISLQTKDGAPVIINILKPGERMF